MRFVCLVRDVFVIDVNRVTTYGLEVLVGPDPLEVSLGVVPSLDRSVEVVVTRLLGPTPRSGLLRDDA